MELTGRHVPVLLSEVLEFLDVKPDGIYIDATVGGGGHTESILGRLAPHGTGRVLGIDQDPAALDRARGRLQKFGETLILTHGNFAAIDALHNSSGLGKANGVVADLGLSSLQLEDAGRGFSFSLPGPLDMRMDPGIDGSAADLVNHLGERDLAGLIFKFGEERHSRQIARAIMKARPIRTTTELAQVVTRAIPSRTGPHHLHPATRTFMALRLAVNEEIENLQQFLLRVPEVLADRGRVVIISFHSLEDRLVKQSFLQWRGQGRARILTRKIVRPSEAEAGANPRSRSAKLRAAERIEDSSEH